MTRGLREILVEAAHALADAIEGRTAPKAKVDDSPRSVDERTELEQRNEQMRLALNDRAQGDLREIQARGNDRPLTVAEIATIAILGAGYRLMPAARDRLGLTTPLKEPRKLKEEGRAGGVRIDRAKPPPRRPRQKRER